ncbi:MAG: DUF3791 domain-containing protein [Bacteroidales bacterium]|jgi:hypothetical protein|nr:DUF3791 domain-containing protein [Bacteroidales bacterium]
MNIKELEFAVFCIENIAERLSLNGKTTYKLLSEDSTILDEYIIPSYDVLHTQSKQYIVDDIIDFMKAKGLLK